MRASARSTATSSPSPTSKDLPPSSSKPTPGVMLYERMSTEMRYPASLTKMMTLYLLFEALQKGNISLSTQMTASAYACSQDPTRLGLDAGDQHHRRRRDQGARRALGQRRRRRRRRTFGRQRISVRRAHDRTRAQMGMAHTTFVNASGLPDTSQKSTAADLVILSRRLIADFPQFYPYFRLAEFRLERPQLRRPQQPDEVLRRRRRFEDRLHAHVGIQPCKLRHPPRQAPDRRRHGRALGARPRHSNGRTARKRIHEAGPRPSGARDHGDVAARPRRRRNGRQRTNRKRGKLQTRRRNLCASSIAARPRHGRYA